jgi:AAA+ ATPase superfamily predicted ATPase
LPEKQTGVEIKNPFKPGKPVDPEYFGGREKELETFRKYLDYSTEGNPHNLAILGERGIGKSSLLRKFQQIASEENDCLVVRRELDTSVDSLSSLTLFMLEALKSEGASYVSGRKRATSKVANFFENYKIGISVLGHGLSVEKSVANRSVAIQDYFYKELMHVWEGVKEGTKGVVFLLDEAEHLQNMTGAWSFLRSIFTRASEEEAGYMLVVSGKLSLFKGIKEIFSPIERFFTPLEVMPMALEEVNEALQRPLEQSLNAKMTDDAVKMVFLYSGGHPYIVQTFGLHIFEEVVAAETTIGRESISTTGKMMMIRSIDVKDVQNIVPKVMTRLTSQLFKDRFDQTSPLERKVLLAICNLLPTGDRRNNEIAPQQIKEFATGRYSIRIILRRLVEKDCLIKKQRGKYSLFTPLFAEYIKARMQSIIAP